MAPMQGWIPACSPTASEPLSVQKAASSEPTPGLSPHPIFPRSTSIYSLCGRELGPAGKDTSCWTRSSTMQYLQGCPTSPRSFSFFDGEPGCQLSLHPHRVLPPWLHLGSFTASSNGLPGSHFSSPARPSLCTPGPQGRGHYWCPRGTSVPGRPSMGCPCTRPRLGGSRGRRPPDHHTWTAKVDNSLTRPVTTSALPRRRVTCAGMTGYLSVRVSGSFWV